MFEDLIRLKSIQTDAGNPIADDGTSYALIDCSVTADSCASTVSLGLLSFNGLTATDSAS